MSSTLHLLPNLLFDEAPRELFLPVSVEQVVSALDGLIAESEKAARRYLKRFSFPEPKTFRDIPLLLLNEHSKEADLQEILSRMTKGGEWGLISDCGLPCLADPGANLVLKARERGIRVKGYSGPSSLMLALMLSGLGAQHFCFHGYLPKEERALQAAIKKMQERSFQEGSTEFFIETPYRNHKLFQALLQHLHGDTHLCLAIDLTSPTEEVITLKVHAWKKRTAPDLDKRPAVFLLRKFNA